jgi:hypothetical protein
VFDHWSNGGPRLQQFTVPASDTTLTATYRQDTGSGGSGTSFEAESMTGVSSTGNARGFSDPAASAGRAVRFIRNATISRTLTVGAFDELGVRAKGSQCQGAPQMRVLLDGSEVLNVPVTAQAWQDHPISTIAGVAGQHSVSISFTNDFSVRGTCDRNLEVDLVRIGGSDGGGEPPPPPPPATASFEAEGMSGVSSTGNARGYSDANASGQRAVFFPRNATISKTTTLPAFQHLIVRARGDQCQGAPTMVVRVDGTQVMSAAVSSTTFADYVVARSAAAGSHKVEISFLNDFTATGCDRNLRVDKVSVGP